MRNKSNIIVICSVIVREYVRRLQHLSDFEAFEKEKN